MRSFSGIFFVALTALAFAMTLLDLSPSFSKTGTPTPEGLLKGKWGPAFERALGEQLPIFMPSKNFWGQAEFAAFNQGRKGVVVGADGWLFTDEEFMCHPSVHMKDNLDYIARVGDDLAKRNIKLAVVLVPSKARLYPDHLGEVSVPACRDGVYADILDFLRQRNIDAVDVLSAMKASPARDRLYFHTDTHWTPEGAQLAAETAAARIASSMSGLTLEKKAFVSKPENEDRHEGDLMRYVPGVGAPYVRVDKLRHYVTSATASGGQSEGDLFGGGAPLVTLVGTSYSANPLWNFEGFLKEALKADILNMADQGQGPFTVMDKYMKSDALRNTPPKLVIWEIPERYVPAPSGIENDKPVL